MKDETAKEIKEILKRKGITQFKLAAILGCAPATVSRWIKGKAKMDQAYKQLIRMHPDLK